MTIWCLFCQEITPEYIFEDDRIIQATCCNCNQIKGVIEKTLEWKKWWKKNKLGNEIRNGMK